MSQQFRSEIILVSRGGGDNENSFVLRTFQIKFTQKFISSRSSQALKSTNEKLTFNSFSIIQDVCP